MFVAVNTEGSLKVKRHDVVFTRPEDNEPEDEVDVVGCCHVTIEETSEHDIFEEDAEAAPLSLEDGGQSTIDELKEVNLGNAWTRSKGGRSSLSDQTRASASQASPMTIPTRTHFSNLGRGHEALSFMDGLSGYNQIRMALDDEEKTAFRTPKVKSKKKCDHLKDLKLVLDRLRKYQLRMNPLKCAFGVTSGKFLGFIVRHRGIEVDHSKVDAIQKMPSPKNLHELRRLQGRLAYIRSHAKNAFDSIKKYLLNSPVLSAPAIGKPLILYIAAQETLLGALLAQENDKGKECALYYLSRTLTGAELNYSPIEKMCLALFFAIDKLRHYMQAFSIHLVAKADPVKYILSRPVISGRLAKWAIILQQYDIVYIPQKAVKGQALADFLADHPVPSNWKLCDDLPDEEVLFVESMEPWIMFFDGATRISGAGVGIVFISLEKHMLPYSFTLGELCSNNVAEYQAFIIGLQMASEFGIKCIEIFGDLKLIINQLSYQYEKVDALANLATALTVSEDIPINISLCQKWIVPSIESQYEEAGVISVYAIDEEDWRQPIIDYLEHGKLPTDPRHRAEIRRRAARFIYYKDTLYTRSYEGLLLRCLGKEESTKALEEAHSGICGVTSLPPEPLHPTIASWPFEAWGLDLVRPITPKSSVDHSYILAGTDYFSKWAEVVPLREAKKENIYKSSMYNAATNELAEAFNKTLCSLLKNVVSKKKRDWQEKIGEALWAYRTTHRTPTCVTPYSLVYGVEAVLPLEREIPSLRMAIQEGLTTKDNARLRLQELEALDEKRLEAQQALKCYQARMSKAFDKQVRPRSFQVGDLVLAVRRPIITTRHTGNKFTPKWDGPYIAKEVFTNGAYKIIDQDGLRIGPINGKFLKKFYT
ncbi:uncharacterized protein E6C27_scaffold468G001940 [Cucumis melo var. makuwa]|uniref:Uncharacterized protein n=1 Tax=Cucumis melo var. makuwa TaxID=1194695 RepID=A0A5A7V9F6_CUCMM|nr:uncharacterized protein E6C27_scaffold468G001940 [Cucumis melo var. makuwa]